MKFTCKRSQGAFCYPFNVWLGAACSACVYKNDFRSWKAALFVHTLHLNSNLHETRKHLIFSWVELCMWAHIAPS